jgi:hypothetical protein
LVTRLDDPQCFINSHTVTVELAGGRRDHAVKRLDVPGDAGDKERVVAVAVQATAKPSHVGGKRVQATAKQRLEETLGCAHVVRSLGASRDAVRSSSLVREAT